MEGAQVSRSSKLSLPAGKSDLVFSEISPQIERQSIQVHADGALTVLAVSQEHNFLKEQEVAQNIRDLETEKEATQDKIQLAKNNLNVFKQEETLLARNQEIKGINTGLKTADLKEAADFQRQRLTEIYGKLFEIEKSIKKYENDLNKIIRQLAALHQQKDVSTGEIIVTVSCKEAVNTRVILSYLVRKAGWYPGYDIRVKDVASPLVLQQKANVYQNSGEDWKEVRLSLSTGNPNRNGVNPKLEPWYLRYLSPGVSFAPQNKGYNQSMASGNVLAGHITDANGKPVSYATVQIKGSGTGTNADANGFYKIEGSPNSVVSINAVGYSPTEFQASAGFANIVLQPGSEALSEVVVTGNSLAGRDDEPSVAKSLKGKVAGLVSLPVQTTTSYQPTTTTYEIELPYTVLNDGKNYSVDINEYEIKAAYEYYAVPKLVPEAFLTAKIVDWQELNLVDGEVNLFFEGTYLGNSYLNISGADDTLQISLGRDPGVVVKRVLQKTYSQKRFLGGNKTDTRVYDIIVRNNKREPISIKVEDQFPISTSKEVDVTKLNYENGVLDEPTQKISWQLSVAPGREAKINFGFSVKYPKDRALKLD